LAIQPVVGRKNIVVLAEGEIRIYTSQHHQDRLRVLLQDWYQKRARKILTERLQMIADKADWVGDQSVPLKLRRMKRTWGNCSSRGIIKLNTHLIKAPLKFIDSVIAHELCHLQEMNHGKAFYALLEHLNPSWRDDRSRLHSEGNRYLL